MHLFCVFFFFKQKTAYEMRISDWSSDVCSSDLAAECEALRRPVDAVWNAIRKTGVFYHFVPRRYGGLEFDIDSFIDAMLPIAEGCASTGWVTAFCVEHNWMLAQFPETLQDETFGGDFPYLIAPGATHPPGVAQPRSAERRVGTECVSRCSSRWTRDH